MVNFDIKKIKNFHKLRSSVHESLKYKLLNNSIIYQFLKFYPGSAVE